MDRYLNDVTKIVKFYYTFFTVAIINFILIILMIFLGLFSLIVPLIIVCLMFILFTILLIKMHFYAKKYVKDMDNYYVFKLDKKYCYDEILSLIENSSFVKDTYKYSEKEILFLFIKKIICRILVLHMDVYDKREYDKIKIKINRAYNKKTNYKFSGRYSRGAAFTKKLRVNIVCLDKENDDIYNYLSNNIFSNFNRAEGTLNIVIIEEKMIVPSVNNGYLWSDYNVIKYKIILDFLFDVFNIDCSK